MTKYKEYNCKKSCGICCIICGHIGLYKREVESKKYKMKKPNSNPKSRFKKILARKRIYLPEVKKHVYSCYYFDEINRLCSIYENRPTLCRNWQHSWNKRVMEDWKKLLKGKSSVACIYG